MTTFRTLLAFAAVSLIACTAGSQTAINSSSASSSSGSHAPTEYIASVHVDMGDSSFTIGWEDNFASYLRINPGNEEGMPIQQIDFSEDGIASALAYADRNRKDALELMDFNNDGFADLRMLASYGAYSGTETYNVWLFNQDTAEFDFSESLSALHAVAVDPATHQVISWDPGNSKGETLKMYHYEWNEDELLLVRSQEQDFVSPSSKSLVRVVKKLVSDKMVEVCRLLIDENGQKTLQSGKMAECGDV
ncbi:MAG: hypothetical protein KBD00_04945 [Candidatus Peribacteraceae bacterium]|nr:hypothetical protein [Candidatus Peribacteraceae bacterium]